MNYLTFDRDVFNGFAAMEARDAYYAGRDYSVFHIGQDDFFSHIDGLRSTGGSGRCGAALKAKLTRESVTILYSFCPFEICGLYAAVSAFGDADTPIYLSCPPSNDDRPSGGPPDAMFYGDYPPGEILSLVQNARLLSGAERQAMKRNWEETLRNQTSLRIWKEGGIVNVPDEYFDGDILSVMEADPQQPNWDLLTRVQLLLRRKYRIGLNGAFIDWRVKTLTQMEK